MWYQNSFLLDPTDRRAMFSKGDKYMLNITHFQPSDFGNYRWVSRSQRGEIDYRPFGILFSSDSFGSSPFPRSNQFVVFPMEKWLWIYALLNDLIICCRKVNLTNLINWPELLSIPSINWGKGKRASCERLLIMLISHLFSCLLAFSCVADNTLGRTKKYIEVSGRPGPAEFLSPTYSGHLDRYNLTFKIESIPVLEEIKLLYRKLMVTKNTIFICDSPHSAFLFITQMNETYQHPGKWHDQILHPSVQRYDSRHFVMSYIIIALEHNSVYEVMVQAKNLHGWNEVIFAFSVITKTSRHEIFSFNFQLS
jgi:hypothetical protein